MSPDKASLERLKIERGPEVEAPPRKWLLLIAAVLVLLAVAVGWWLTRPVTAEVRTAAVREASGGGGGTVLNASGYVTARRQATVSSKVTGKVLEVLIEEGMEVEEGQVMARLDRSNVEVGFRLAEARLAAARSAVTETAVLLAEAELELGRARRLLDGEVGSQAELDRAQASRDSLAARLERQRDEIAVAEREVAVWRQQLEDLVIRAPFAGVVVAKNAQPGEMISPISAGGGFTRTGIGTVVDMDSLEIEVDVNESYINRVRSDQEVEATLDAYPDWKIPARVIAIIPTADRQKATVEVRIGFVETDARILPDMGVKVAFREAEGARSVPLALVPKAAIRSRGGKDTVLLVADGRVERRAVTVAGTLGDDIQVRSGLAPGERVIVEGPPELEEGDLVKEAGG